MIARSALAVTGSLTVAVLLVGSGSAVSASTLAVLAMVPVASGLRTALMVTVTMEPGASDATLQVTVPLVTVQVPALAVTLTSVRESAVLSVRTTFCASEGPSLRTVIW